MITLPTNLDNFLGFELGAAHVTLLAGLAGVITAVILEQVLGCDFEATIVTTELECGSVVGLEKGLVCDFGATLVTTELTVSWFLLLTCTSSPSPSTSLEGSRSFPDPGTCC